ncbi:MAG TPA: DUF4142 domain-containing protein [Longimicrobiales bacterium]
MQKLTRTVVVSLIVAALGTAACAPAETTVTVQPAPGIMPDASIAGVISTANQAQIEQGELASSKASDSAVRAFAERMVTEHRNVGDQFRSVLEQANVSTATSTTATQLEETADRTIETLRSLEGAAFDRTYMDSQVSLHEWLLRTLDETLIPAAQDDSIEQQLRTIRTGVAGHLEEARTIRQNLGS